MSISRAASVPGYARGLHVLLVDRDMTNLSFMKALLQLNYYKVTTEGSAPSALSMILQRTCNCDIVIVEVEMPDIDGFQFLQRIQLREEIPVILMGSNLETGMTERALSLGACSFLQKPIGVDDLTAIWHHAFRRKVELSDSTGQIESFSSFTNGVLVTRKAETEESDLDESDAEREISDIKRIGAKRRMVWTPELDRKFQDAVSELGETNAKPLQIMRAMNPSNLTLRQIGSHLQKYRKRARETGVMIQNSPVFGSMSRRQRQNGHKGQSQVLSNLSSGMGVQNTCVRNSSMLPPQEFIYGRPQKLWNSPYLSNSMEGQNAAIPTQDFSNAQCLKHRDSPFLSTNIGGQNTSSVRPTEDFNKGQRLWDSSYLANTIGCQNTNVRNSNFSYGQRQKLWNSPYLSSSTTGQNTSSVTPTQDVHGQPQKLWDPPYLSNSMGGQNTSSVMPAQDFDNGRRPSDSPYLSNYMEGQNTNVRNSSVMPAQNFNYEQHRKLWGSLIGGLNTNVTNSWATPAQSFNFGQRQTFSDLPNLSGYMGGPNTNLRNSMMVPAPNFQNGQSQKLGDLPNLLLTQSSSFAQRPGLFDLPNSWNCRGGLNTTSVCQPQSNFGSSPGYHSNTYLKILENCNSSYTNNDQSVQADVVAKDLAQTNIQEESAHNRLSVQLAESVVKMNLAEESAIASKRLSASQKGKGILCSDSYERWVDAGVHLTSKLFDSLRESSADDSATVIADALECMMKENNSQDLYQTLDCMVKENDYQKMQVQEFSPAWKGLAQDTDIMNDVMEPNSMEGSDVTNMEPIIIKGSDAPNMEPKSMGGSYVQYMEPKTVEGSNVPSCSKTQEQEPWVTDDMMELLAEDASFEEWLKLPPNAKFGFIQ